MGNSLFVSFLKSYEDAAVIDGCSRLQALWYISYDIAPCGGRMDILHIATCRHSWTAQSGKG